MNSKRLVVEKTNTTCKHSGSCGKGCSTVLDSAGSWFYKTNPSVDRFQDTKNDLLRGWLGLAY